VEQEQGCSTQNNYPTHFHGLIQVQYLIPCRVTVSPYKGSSVHFIRIEFCIWRELIQGPLGYQSNHCAAINHWWVRNKISTIVLMHMRAVYLTIYLSNYLSNYLSIYLSMLRWSGVWMLWWRGWGLVWSLGSSTSFQIAGRNKEHKIMKLQVESRSIRLWNCR
jgi:hypothetical protein